MTSLEDNVVNLVMAFLDRSPLNDGQFGRKAVNHGGFVASLRKGAIPKMDIADRALRFMGEPMIGPAFRAEIATFLVVTGTRGSTLGHRALENPNFVRRLNEGGSPRLDTVQKVRAWMRETASFGERAEIARAIADPDVSDPALNPDPGAVNALAEGKSRADAESENRVGGIRPGDQGEDSTHPDGGRGLPQPEARHAGALPGRRRRSHLLQARRACAVFPDRPFGLGVGQTPGEPS